MGAREFLSQHGHPFVYHNVMEDPEAKERAMALTGGRFGNPTILVDGKVVMSGGVFTPDIFAGVDGLPTRV
ncbi:MAG: glutaredoxin family protein [Clostridia bacterium]